NEKDDVQEENTDDEATAANSNKRTASESFWWLEDDQPVCKKTKLEENKSQLKVKATVKKLFEVCKIFERESDWDKYIRVTGVGISK
ncbi:unnamed protein product, partial [Porites lobata]